MTKKTEKQALSAKATVDHGVLATHITHWKDALKQFELLPCETEEQEAQWGMWVSKAQDTIKTLEDERKLKVGPFNEVVSDINADYREAREPAESFKELGKKKLGDCALRRKLAADAAHEAMRLAAQAGDADAVYEALALVPEDVKVKGASTTFTWELDEDAVELDLVPVVFLAVNPDQVKKYIKGFKGAEPAAVPGLKFRQVANTAARGSRKK